MTRKYDCHKYDVAFYEFYVVTSIEFKIIL